MPSNLASLQAALLQHLIENGALTDSRVAAAFRAVPRHLFLPQQPAAEVYADEAIPTKMGDGRPISSSSQPSMMAIMLEQLGLGPGQRVLEIGAGTGYNAALVANLVGPEGQVVTIDIDDDIVDAAREHLAAAGASNVIAVCGDGALGYAPLAPYDRIIVTVGAWEVTPAWLEQLKPGGRLVVPLALAGGGQKSLALEKTIGPAPEDPLLISLSIRDCAFMRLRGAFAGPEHLTSLGPDPGLMLGMVTELPVPPETVYAWLMAGGQDTRTGLRLARRDVWQGLGFWLGVSEALACDLMAIGEHTGRSLLPSLFEFEGSHPASINMGVLTPDGLCLLWLAPAGPLTLDRDTAPHDLMARTFGPPSRAAVTARVLGHLAAWDAAGRPGSTGMQVQVYPATARRSAGPGEIVVNKRWSKLLISWTGAAA